MEVVYEIKIERFARWHAFITKSVTKYSIAEKGGFVQVVQNLLSTPPCLQRSSNRHRSTDENAART